VTAHAGASRAAFGFVFVVVLLDMLSFGVIIPVLTPLIKQFEGGNSTNTAFMLGVFGTVWAAMQFVCAPILGALSDRFGRRPVILISIAGLGIDYVFMALAPTLALLMVGRVISGITTSSFSTAGAYIADVTPPDKRAAKFGLLGAAFGIGFVIGPALGGWLGSIGLRLPFWVAAGLALTNAVYGVFVLPESLKKENRTPFRWSHANPLGSLRLLRSHHELFGLAIATFLFMLAHESHPVIFVLYGDVRYGWGARTVGSVLAIVGVTQIIVQAGLVGRMVAWLGERKAALTGLAFGVLSFAINGAATTGAMFMIGIPVGGLFGLVSPSIQGIMTRRVGPNEQGQLQGAQGSVVGIASMVAPALYTQTFAAGIGSLHIPGAPYFLASALLVCSGAVVWFTTRKTATA
jgi:DHA1 family tetracycline resistance protein-like MFS transporter